MLLDIFDTVIGGINSVGESLGLSWISVIALALLLITIVISFCATIFSSELKTARAVEKLNAYLESNPFINDENLVEFNKLMKKIPAPMRAQWQQFMVNRDKKPSEFFTEDRCIDKPFKASGYKNHITAVKTIIICLAIVSFVFSIGAVSSATSTLAVVLVESLLLPLLIVFIGAFYLLFLKARRNSSISDLYGIFANFQHAIDRAVTTLPDYVDYEILFTRKEIVSGIPVLQQYLQQRALFEQEQIRKAKESQVEHEEYDFSSLGINGSLVMERAMRECEYYLGNRKRVLAEISELQGSRDLLEKSYEEKNKTNQRKLRDIQESLDRLKEKLDNTTNIIVGNDLRKQRENEIQKQRQLEKEVEEDNNKYDADKKAIEKQIEDKKAEIEGFRKTAESALNGEFKTYADKIYADIKGIVDEQYKEEFDGLKANNQELQIALEERDKAIAEKTVIYDEKLQVIQDYSDRIAEQDQKIAELQSASSDVDGELSSKDQQIESKDKEIFDINKELESRKLEIEKKNNEIESLKQTIKDLKHKKKVEVYRYFDANGNEFYVDENGNPYYADENGNAVYGEQINEQPVEQDVSEQEPVEQNSDFADDTANANEEYQEVENQDLQLDLQEVDKPKEVVEEPEQITELSTEDIDKMLAELDVQMAEEQEDESKKSKPEPEFHKPVDDFKWENSNSPEQFEKEPEETPKEEVVEQPAEEPVEAVQEQPAEPENAEKVENEEENKVEQEPAQDIESIEKEIENQTAELEQQTKNLSAQLEETKALADAEVKAEEKPAKKASSKKATKKPAAKKQANKTAKSKTPAKKSTAKKSEDKKPATKKAEDKKSSAKPKSTAKSAPKAKKPEAKKADKASKPAKKTKPAGDNGDITVGDLSLMEFNEQLKSVLKEINEDNN